eukprot:scaffold212488_cov21-Tisochrysis_lutea.AAC.1
MHSEPRASRQALRALTHTHRGHEACLHKQQHLYHPSTSGKLTCPAGEQSPPGPPTSPDRCAPLPAVPNMHNELHVTNPPSNAW